MAKESVTKAFKRASGLADALEKRLNLQLRARRNIFGPKWKPVKRFLYYAMPNGKAASVAGFNPINEKLKKIEHDDVMCRFGPDDRWRCWAVKHSPPEYVIVVLFNYCIVWDAANNKMATKVTLNQAQGGGVANFPCFYPHISEWVNEKTEAEATETIWTPTNYGLGTIPRFHQDQNDTGSNAYGTYSSVAQGSWGPDAGLGGYPTTGTWVCTNQAKYGNKAWSTSNFPSYYWGAHSQRVPNLVVPSLTSYASYRLAPRSGIGSALWRAVEYSQTYTWSEAANDHPSPPGGWDRHLSSSVAGSITFFRPLLSSNGGSVSFSFYSSFYCDNEIGYLYSDDIPNDTCLFVFDLWRDIRSKENGLHVAIDLLGLATDKRVYRMDTWPGWVSEGFAHFNDFYLNYGDVTPSVAAICKISPLDAAPPMEINSAFSSAISNLFAATTVAGAAYWTSGFNSSPLIVYIRKPKPPAP